MFSKMSYLKSSCSQMYSWTWCYYWDEQGTLVTSMSNYPTWLRQNARVTRSKLCITV